MNKKLIAALLSLSMAVSLCSCSEGDSSKADSSSVSDTTTTTTTTATTTTAEPEPQPQKQQLELDGYGMLDEAVAIDNSGNAMCVAKGAVNAKFRDKYVDIFTIDNIVDGSLIVTCTLSENEIEKKYGIKLEIASEATGIIVDFAMMPSDSFEYAREALDVLDRELARYPEGFLTQIKHGDADVLRFYLAADVISFTTSFESGGVCTTYNGEIIIALEVGDEPFLESSIHHELSHAIDIYVENKLNNPEFSEGWDALNPQDDIRYSEGEAQLHELYIESFYSNIDTAGAYYVDNYGHTNATEDRARIFETVMSDGNYTVKFDEAPFLMAKLNYYAESIRKAFDGSENWGEVPWEKYMDN